MVGEAVGEDAVVGEVVGEETTTQRRGFWAKKKCRAPAGRNDFFIRFPLKNQMLLGLCDWGVGASRVTLAIALALLRCTAVLLLLLFPKRGQGGSQGQLDL